MFKSLFSLVLLVFVSAPAFAQALPFVKAPLGQEALAQAIEAGNFTVLNIQAKDYVEAVNGSFGLELKTNKELAAYIRQLSRVACPVGYQSTLGRVLPSGVIDLYGFKRKFVEGEECLLDTNTARYVVSLLCGNVITATDLPIFGAVAPEPETIRMPGSLTGPLGASTRTPVLPEELVPASTSRNPERSSGSSTWWSRNKKWVIPALAGVAVGGAVCAATGCFKMKQRQVVTVTIR